MAKVGGGINPMHLSNDAHPFQKKFGNHSGAGKARMTGLAGNPGGGGDKISANAEMRKKRPLNGPGDAK